MNFEGAEDPFDFRLVIERQKKTAFEILEQSRKLDIIFFSEIKFVMRKAKIRRIDIKESVGPVVARDDLLIRPALKLNPKQPLMSHVQKHRNPMRVVIRAALDTNPEILALDEAAEAVFLKIEETGCTLNLRECPWGLRLKQREPFAARCAKLQIPHELMVVELADAKEVEDLLIEVVQYFDS